MRLSIVIYIIWYIHVIDVWRHAYLLDAECTNVCFRKTIIEVTLAYLDINIVFANSYRTVGCVVRFTMLGVVDS